LALPRVRAPRLGPAQVPLPKSAYGGPIDRRGLPAESKVPDVITGNRPPTLSQQGTIAKSRYWPNYRNQNLQVETGIDPGGRPSSGPVRPMSYTPLGALGATPVANFLPNPSGTGFNSTFTGIGTGQNSPQLAINPIGQYTQMAAGPSLRPEHKGKFGPAPGKKKKKPKYADSEYLSELRAIEKALAAYRSKMGVNRTRAGTQFKISGRDLRQQKDRDLENLKDDFAARGIVLSGVYGDKQGEYNQLWGQQNSELGRQYKDALSDITRNYNEYLQETNTQKEQARLAAIRRRAQKLGKL
jgi:hypothetical protein